MDKDTPGLVSGPIMRARRRVDLAAISNLAVYRYGVAAVAVLAAVGVRSAFDPILGPSVPYLPFALAVMVVGRYGGRGPALIATAMSALSVVLFFLPRHPSLTANPLAGADRLAIFVAIGVLLSWSLGYLRESLLSSARADEVLRRQAQLINLSHDAVITADANGIIIGWNAGAVEVYGWTEAEAVGKVIHDLLHTGDHMPLAEIERVLYRDGRWGGELLHAARDGRQIVTESRQVLLRDGSGAPMGLLQIDRDITERKRAQQQLAEAHREITAILESISDGFNAFDREWRCTYVNAAGAKMVGKRPEELLGKSLFELWPQVEDSPFGRAYRRAVAENVPFRVEGFYAEPLNAWLEVRCYPSPERRSLFFTDVTERRRAEERLRQTQKLETVGLLAGGIAHDFNNLLTVIMGSASAVLAERPGCQYVQAILSASERAASLTGQLLAYAGKGRFVTELVDLTELVSQATELLRASVPKRVRLSFNLFGELPCVEADPSRIEQIVMNLVINGGEAIPAKTDGLVEITTRACEVTPEIARQHSQDYDVPAGAHVCLEVADNGSGMDEATISRIFDPFFSTKFTGRGLGLAAVHGIVRTAKGFIEVRSSPGRGTTFRVMLPASGRKRTARVPRIVPPEQVRGVAAILVVDDEETVRTLTCMHLRRQGYEVQEARDGKDALQVLAQSPSLPSLVLLDLAMPVMGGDELVPILQSRYPGLKVILSSGYPEEEARRLSTNGSVAGFLQKPYTGIALVEKIAQVLGEARATVVDITAGYGSQEPEVRSPE